MFCDCCNQDNRAVHIIDQETPTSEAQVSKSDKSNIMHKKEEYNNDYWQQFFQERGAGLIWKELEPLQLKKQKAVSSIHVVFAHLHGSPTPDQIYEVAKGIIDYLLAHQIQVKKLFFIGDLDQNSGKRLHQLPSNISELTSLTTLTLAHNALTDLPQELDKLTRLTRLEVKNNQLSTLPASLYFNELSSMYFIYSHKNPWLVEEDIKRWKGVTRQVINPSSSDEELRELADNLCNKQVVFFSSIQEIDGNSYSLPFKWAGPAGSAEEINKRLANLRGKSIYSYSEATLSGGTKEK